VQRFSLPLVLALVMLMVLPVHGTATRTELTVLPAADGMIAPHGSVGVPALDWGAPELPAGSPPQRTAGQPGTKRAASGPVADCSAPAPAEVTCREWRFEGQRPASLRDGLGSALTSQAQGVQPFTKPEPPHTIKGAAEWGYSLPLPCGVPSL